MSDSPRARFVVGTGRCGSTLLSRMLAKNTDVLNVFEMFSGIDYLFRFKPEPVSGTELADRLRQDHPVLTMTLKRGYTVPEVVYPFDDPESRYNLGDPVPWMLGIAIARISDKPDDLFDELLSLVESWPERHLSVHYREILDWLTRRCGKSCWIERSGTTIETLPELVDFFPDAKFLHIHRHGHEAALSIREYTTMRVAVAVLYGLLGDIEFSYEGLTELERNDRQRLDELFESYAPVELYGRYWSDQVKRGYGALDRIAPEDYFDLRFEDLVTRPREILEQVAEFLEIGTGDWLDEAAQLARGLPEPRFPSLSADEQQRLSAACADALALLGR